MNVSGCSKLLAFYCNGNSISSVNIISTPKILTAFTCALVLVHHIPSLARLLRGQEEKLSLVQDLGYKFDEKL